MKDCGKSTGWGGSDELDYDVIRLILWQVLDIS